MRTVKDRVRHAILFEVILLLVTLPLITFILNKPLEHVGGMMIYFSLMAIIWNYIYNILFDKALLKLGYSVTVRHFKVRTVHALLFELGFALLTIPAVMMILGISLWQSIVMEIGFIIGIPIYAYVYNWLYDVIFPISVEPAIS